MRALVVLMRYKDDGYDPSHRDDWPLGADSAHQVPFVSGLLDSAPAGTIPDPATFRDSTLSRYFYDQSRQGSGSGRHLLFGDVVPFIHETQYDQAWYDSTGLGYAAKEALDRLFPSHSDSTAGFYDPADYDLNADGVLDHIFFMVRHDTLGYGWWGCAGLGTACGPYGIPGPQSYYSASRGEWVNVDWRYSGSWVRSFPAYRWKYRPHFYYLRVTAHEYGHNLWDPYMLHLNSISGNDVPASGSGSRYALMGPGINAHDLQISTHERDLLGWVSAPALTASGSYTLDKLYEDGEALRVALSGDGAGQTLYLSNRQRDDYFTELYEIPDNADIGLLETGVLATLRATTSARDVLPSSNVVPHGPEYPEYSGVMYGDDGQKTQLTPWTRPSTHGWAVYPALSRCGELNPPASCGQGEDPCPNTIGTGAVCPPSGDSVGVWEVLPETFRPYDLSWEALSEVEVRAPINDVLVDFASDFRLAPVLREDSWMGPETDGETISGLTRVTNGATLTLHSRIKPRSTEPPPDDPNDGDLRGEESDYVYYLPTTVTFDELRVEPGSHLIVQDDVTLVVNDDLIVESGAFVTFEAGSIARFGSGARLEASALTATGTAADPVLFARAAPAAAWDGLRLLGTTADAHDLDHIRIEGAKVGLDLRASSDVPGGFGVSVAHAALDGNGIAVSTDYASCGGFCLQQRAAVWLDHVLADSSGTYGLYLRNADFALTNSTVRGGDGHGVYVRNATAAEFAANVIEANGTGGPGYDGLRVEANASIDFSVRGDVAGYPGLNRIGGHPDKEVVYLKGGYLVMGIAGFGGDQNAVLGTGSGCRVYNNSGSTLEAEDNFWGTTTAPPSGYFCGGDPVDRTPYLSSDPTGGSGGGYRPEASDPMLALASRSEGRTIREVSRGSDVRGGGEQGGNPNGDPNEDPVAWLRAEIRAARGALTAAQDAPGAPALVRRLAGLHRLDRGDATGEGPASNAVLRALRRLLSQGNPGALPPALRRTAESAAVVALESALAAGDHDAADALLSAFEPHVAGEAQALTLALDAVAVDEAHARYDAALARIAALIAVVGDGHDGLGDDLVFLAEVIAAKAAEGAAGRGGESEDAGAVTAKGNATAMPTEYALAAAYPNPFTGRTTLPLALPETAEVRLVVYDLLGREVAVVADERMEAGRHALSFDGSRLASGVYVVQARVGGDVDSRVLTSRVTLVR